MDNSESKPSPKSSVEEHSKSDGSSPINVETKDDETKKEESLTFSTRSISVTASSLGISSISEDVCHHIADELYYKTKELIYMSKLILNQNKSPTLTCNEVKKAMQLLGGVQIYGQSSKDEPNFIHIPKADIYVEDDPEIDLLPDALSNSNYTLKAKKPFIRGSWVMPEGYALDPATDTACSYYKKIVKTILTGSPAHIKVALTDIRTNPKIGPLCPYLLNLVSLTVKKTKVSLLDHTLINALLGTVHSIVHNKFVDPSPFLAVNRAANSLLRIVINPDVAKEGDYFVDNDDDLSPRMKAGLLLAKVVIVWGIEVKQQIDIVKHLLTNFWDQRVPLQIHYGAAVTLTAMGYRRHDYYFWGLMERYLPQLGGMVKSKKYCRMVQHIMTVFLVAVRSTLKNEQGKTPQQLKQLHYVDSMLYVIFGDTITPWRHIADPPIFKCVNSPVIQNHLKLKIRRVKPLNDLSVWQETFSSSFDVKRKRQSVNKIDKAAYKKHAYPYVHRNFKFCTPLYKRCASGDLLLML